MSQLTMERPVGVLDREPRERSVPELHRAFAEDRDPAALQRLVEEYERYAVSLAHRLHRHREGMEDLEQIAREALIVALHRYEPERGIPFPAFATPTIMGAIRRHYRDHGWLVRVPRWVHDTTVARNQVTERLTSELGREPTVDELAVALEVDPRRLGEAEAAARARNPESLDAPLGDEGTLGHELVGALDAQLARAETRVALHQAMEELTPRERELVSLYFFEARSQASIATVYGVSQMQISRWLSSLVARIRSRLSEDRASGIWELC